ncbi:hypothetical protein IWQ62_003801 [Dispira parvispora]|uniref:Uncharacterized protein n=1 Tax=Dispira parvispora TaxID=1520584 RepID=A0A9W8E6R1_9FUNG|nr:hypothetical protein IWQ62_003801 [Dispira parvispora]
MAGFLKPVTTMVFLFWVLALIPHVLPLHGLAPPNNFRQDDLDIESLRRTMDRRFNTPFEVPEVLPGYRPDQETRIPDQNAADTENSVQRKDTRLRRIGNKIWQELRALKFRNKPAEATGTDGKTPRSELAGEKPITGTENNTKSHGIDGELNPSSSDNQNTFVERESNWNVEKTSEGKNVDAEVKSDHTPASPTAENDLASQPADSLRTIPQDRDASPVDESETKMSPQRVNTKGFLPRIVTDPSILQTRPEEDISGSDLANSPMSWSKSSTLVGTPPPSSHSTSSAKRSYFSKFLPLSPTSSRSNSPRSDSTRSFPNSPLSSSETLVGTNTDHSDTRPATTSEVKDVKKNNPLKWSTRQLPWSVIFNPKMWPLVINLRPLDEELEEFKRQHPQADSINREIILKHFTGPHLSCIVLDECSNVTEKENPSSLDYYRHHLRVFKSMYRSWIFFTWISSEKRMEFFNWVNRQLKGSGHLEAFTLQFGGIPFKFYVSQDYHAIGAAGLYVFDKTNRLDQMVMNSFPELEYVHKEKQGIVRIRLKRGELANESTEPANHNVQVQPTELAHLPRPAAVSAQSVISR